MKSVVKFDLGLFKHLNLGMPKEVVLKGYNGYLVFDETFTKKQEVINNVNVESKAFTFKGYLFNKKEVLLVSGTLEQIDNSKEINMTIVNPSKNSANFVKLNYNEQNSAYYGKTSDDAKFGYKLNKMSYVKETDKCLLVYSTLSKHENTLTDFTRSVYDKGSSDRTM